jgi:protein TonB
MSVAALPDQPGSHGVGRWSVSLAVVLTLHAGLFLYLRAHPISVEPPGTPPAAVMIELAPEPAPAPEPKQVVAPEPPPPLPQPPPTEPPPPEPVPLPETPPPLPEPPPPPKAVALPKPPPPRPKLPPKPRRVVEQPAPAIPRPVSPPPPAAAPPAPPRPSAAALAGARANWQARLVGWLARYKRYPRVAEEQRQEGTVYLHFTMDRGGHVLSARVQRSSGFPLLDEEVLALIRRAQPLPALPPEMAVARIELVVPVAFKVRR